MRASPLALLPCTLPLGPRVDSRPVLRALLALLLAVLARAWAKTRVMGSRAKSTEHQWGSRAAARGTRRGISSFSRQLAVAKTKYSYDSLDRRIHEFQYLSAPPCSGASFTRTCIESLPA